MDFNDIFFANALDDAGGPAVTIIDGVRTVVGIVEYKSGKLSTLFLIMRI